MKKLLLLLLLLIGCSLDSEETIPTYTYTLNVDHPIRIEIMDVQWTTYHIVLGNISSDDVDVEGMKIKWYTDMYWDRTDSSGYLQMLSRSEIYGKWHDVYKDTITYRYRDGANHIPIVEPYSIVNSSGNFRLLLSPVKTMQGCMTCPNPYLKNGSFMRLWWEVNEVLVDSMEIFLMD